MKKSRTVVKVKGLNQERAINSISKEIKIYNIKRKSHNICTMEVDFKHKNKLVSLLNAQNLEVLEVSSQGFKWKLKRFITSYGLLVGIVICALFYTCQYNFVWRVEVVGAETLSKRELEKFIETNLASRKKSEISSKKIQQSLLENFEEISSASVAIVGQSLVININEAIIPEEMQTENQAIKSNFDGLITDINIVQGTLAVDVGDIVKKGDVLVYPYIIDSQGQQREVVPKAEIWADIWISASETHYDYLISTTRTGKELAISEVYLYDMLIYSSAKKCEFKEFEICQTSSYLNKNNILPFIIKKTTYYELKTEETFQDFSNVKDDIIEKARQKALIFLQENEIIKEEKYTIREGGGLHEVNYLVTVNRNIGGWMQINFDGVGFKYKRLIRKIYAKALEMTENNAENLSVSLSFQDKEGIKKLNNQFRKIDKATDVLSFPMLDIVYTQKVSEFKDEATPDGTLFLGDIVICPEIAKEQANYYNHSQKREVAFLALHGLLHLLGYDHIEKDDEEIMTATSEEILQSLNIKRGK